MSYQKVLSLANKFAQDDHNDLFVRKYKALLSEMEGDYMTLRIKGLDRPILHEFGKLYHNLFEIFKSAPDTSVIMSILSRFLSQHTSMIHKLDETIQDFLKQNQVDFIPGASLKQAEIHSLKKLFGLTKTTFPITQPVAGPQTTKEEYVSPSKSNDQTRVETLIGK